MLGRVSFLMLIRCTFFLINETNGLLIFCQIYETCLWNLWLFFLNFAHSCGWLSYQNAFPSSSVGLLHCFLLDSLDDFYSCLLFLSFLLFVFIFSLTYFPFFHLKGIIQKARTVRQTAGHGEEGGVRLSGSLGSWNL